jgi:hypothetical protein
MPSDEHAVITHLPLSDDGFGTAEEREAVHELEDRIETAAAERRLAGFTVSEGAYAVKRYGRAGDPGAREERVELRASDGT